ncbi:MAG: TRAP transporter large permease subunit, partial [Pirellulales bacterium]|nr:TRAP transporter large permease subunit [Pirellulales bacterium]
DTVFYLLLPLARSLTRRTGGHYVLFLLAVTGGGVIGHTLIPPTPGPLLMANLLNIDLGMMFLIGPMIGIPTAVVSLYVAKIIDRRVNLPMRPYQDETTLEPLADERLPGLLWSLAPIVLPIILISSNSVISLVVEKFPDISLASTCSKISGIMAILGNPSMALIISGLIAMWILLRTRKLTFKQLSEVTESALKGGGVIILITAAGGAFGAMLRESGLTETICGFVGNESGKDMGTFILCLAYGVAVVLKWAQGSGTVAMITTAGMFAGMGVSSEMLGCHPAYLAMAIGSGSATGSWLNDSGFWIYSRMGGLDEWESLQTWTVLLVILGITSFAFTMLFAWLLPFSS